MLDLSRFPSNLQKFSQKELKFSHKLRIIGLCFLFILLTSEEWTSFLWAKKDLNSIPHVSELFVPLLKRFIFRLLMKSSALKSPRPPFSISSKILFFEIFRPALRKLMTQLSKCSRKSGGGSNKVPT